MDELDSSGSGEVAAPQETSSEVSTEQTTDTSAEPSIESTESAEKQSEGTTDVPAETGTKPKQDPSVDRVMREMRLKTEAAERRASEVELQRTRDIEIAKKYGQFGVYSDADVAEKYGKSHGLNTVAEFEAALKAEEREAHLQELKDSGIDPELVNKIVAEHPDVKQARENNQALEQARQAAAKVQEDHFLVESFNELSKEFDEIKVATDVPADVWRVWRNGQSGITLKQAYAAVNYESIATKKAEAAKQAALNNIQSKDHVRGNGKGIEGDTVRIPDDVMEMYMSLNPGKSMAEYQKHWKKAQNK